MDEAVEQLLVSSLTTLREQLNHSAPEVRGLAIFRLAKHHPDQARLAMPRFFADADAQVQSRTAVASGLLGNRSLDLLPAVRTARLDPVAEVRAASWHLLTQLQDTESGPQALAALRDDAQIVRQAALAAIGALKPADAEADLLRIAQEGVPELTRAALLALADLGSDLAKTRLLEFADNPVHPDRVGVALALHRIAPTTSLQRFKALLHDENASLREQATRALAELDGLETLELYVSVLEDPAPQVRQIALKVLSALDTPRARQVMQKYVTGQVNTLLKIFRGSNSQAMRQASREAAGLGPSAAPLLLEKLPEASPVGRFYLSQSISASQHPEVLDATLKQLHRPLSDRGLRQIYERILFGYRGQLRPHVENFLDDPLAEVRESGVRLLASLRYKDQPAADLLTAALEDVAQSVRLEAAVGLAVKRDEAARKILETTLRQGPEDLRFPAFLGILNYPPDIALPVIGDILDTIQPVHLGNICFRLSQLKDRRATQLIVKAIQRMDPRSKSRGISYLQRQNTQAAAHALGVLHKHKEPAVRRAAQDALRRMKHPEAKKILQQLGVPPSQEPPKRDSSPFLGADGSDTTSALY
ncbi:MAG: HEAT repeat domain-containing protein [Planctomycetota bacterium]|nr:HEAT repeat domain-containing protein [Planctomycetota bacterium]